MCATKTPASDVVSVPLVTPPGPSELRQRRGSLFGFTLTKADSPSAAVTLPCDDAIRLDDGACADALLDTVVRMLKESFFHDALALQAGTLRCVRQPQYDSPYGTAYSFSGGPVLRDEHAMRRLVSVIAVEWPGVRWVGDIEMKRLHSEHVVLRLRNAVAELRLCTLMALYVLLLWLCGCVAQPLMRSAWCADYEQWLSVAPAARTQRSLHFTVLENTTLALAHAQLC
jgi:hypothetical protein